MSVQHYLIIANLKAIACLNITINNLNYNLSIFLLRIVNFILKGLVQLLDLCFIFLKFLPQKQKYHYLQPSITRPNKIQNLEYLRTDNRINSNNKTT